MHNLTNQNLLVIAVIVIALFYLITAHGVHLLAFLPFSFLLGCLFMHMFMHSGHGSHHSHDQKDSSKHNHHS